MFSDANIINEDVGDILALENNNCQALLKYVKTPVIVVQKDVIKYINPAFCELFKVSELTILLKSFEDHINERSRSVFIGWLNEKSPDSKKPLQLSFQLKYPEAEFRWVNATFVHSTWNETPSVIGFLIDVEERKRTRDVEEQLRQSQKMEAVGRLAGGIAHDMNNVLGAIMGFASVMEAEMSTEDRCYNDVEQILATCKKGRNLTLNLLGFARRGKYRLSQFTLNEKITEVVELLKHTISKKISIGTDLSPDAIEIHGDPSQIQHAIMNICINAVDAMGDSGQLTIISDTLELTEAEQTTYPDLCPGTYARLCVIDTGTGMSSNVMDVVFEPFFTTKPQGEGSGLGLPMVYGTITNHGGTVMLESTVNKGTVVTLLLPSSKTVSGAFRTLAERRTPSNLNIATILLVDDEEMIRNASKRILEKLGYRVLLAKDGREGLRTFVENKDRISAVMLDLMMPVMDGEETLIKMKEIDAEIPIILASGFSKEEKAEELIALGANGFIQKPFDMLSLKTSLAGILSSD